MRTPQQRLAVLSTQSLPVQAEVCLAGAYGVAFVHEGKDDALIFTLQIGHIVPQLDSGLRQGFYPRPAELTLSSIGSLEFLDGGSNLQPSLLHMEALLLSGQTVQRVYHGSCLDCARCSITRPLKRTSGSDGSKASDVERKVPSKTPQHPAGSPSPSTVN